MHGDDNDNPPLTVYRAGAGPSRSSAQPSPAAARQHRKLQTNLELGMAPPGPASPCSDSLVTRKAWIRWTCQTKPSVLIHILIDFEVLIVSWNNDIHHQHIYLGIIPGKYNFSKYMFYLLFHWKGIHMVNYMIVLKHFNLLNLRKEPKMLIFEKCKISVYG